MFMLHQKGIKNVVSSSGTALTPEQIRLVNRLTKNITVLFDGDAAGIRASLRGIDLILEQGMNVKVCTFPDGEDPDSFAKQNTFEELALYLQENAKDFIAYKAALLMEEAKNDPVKKAALIRDMVTSISKIPDSIQTEIYVQECARIMDISEEVLFSTLAQIGRKELRDANKAYQTKQKAFEVVKHKAPLKKVDVQFELEHVIIKTLLLYGNKKEDFEDFILKENEEGELVEVRVVNKTRVFEKIYLDLQEDEMEFSNDNFRELYYTLIDTLNQNPESGLENFINKVNPEFASDVTNILMNDERYSKSDWERKNVYIKKLNIPQLVSQTILSLRCFLIDQKVNEFMSETIDDKSKVHKSVLEEARDYKKLKTLLSRKLERVI
ncbi:toprim domain-containing protein [bacterium AH-315-P13]|nr:toprim domain-containing protein [bacterium AH-315-P13]